MVDISFERIKMLEKEVEKFLVREVKKIGGVSFKFISPGNAGVPDRIVILPTGKVVFVELKTDKGKLTKLQEVQIKKIRLRSRYKSIKRYRGSERVYK